VVIVARKTYGIGNTAATTEYCRVANTSNKAVEATTAVFPHLYNACLTNTYLYVFKQFLLVKLKKYGYEHRVLVCINHLLMQKIRGNLSNKREECFYG